MNGQQSDPGECSGGVGGPSEEHPVLNKGPMPLSSDCTRAALNQMLMLYWQVSGFGGGGWDEDGGGKEREATISFH